MDIFIYNHNGSAMPNKIHSDSLVLRIHTNPYATFNGCLAHVCFQMESRCNKVNGIGLWCLSSSSFLGQFLHSLYIFTPLSWGNGSNFFLNWTWDALLKKVQYLGWQTETCQNFQIYILATEGQRGKPWAISVHLMLWIIPKKPWKNSTLYTKESKTVIIIHKIHVL